MLSIGSSFFLYISYNTLRVCQWGLQKFFRNFLYFFALQSFGSAGQFLCKVALGVNGQAANDRKQLTCVFEVSVYGPFSKVSRHHVRADSVLYLSFSKGEIFGRICHIDALDGIGNVILVVLIAATASITVVAI